MKRSLPNVIQSEKPEGKKPLKYCDYQEDYNKQEEDYFGTDDFGKNWSQEEKQQTIMNPASAAELQKRSKPAATDSAKHTPYSRKDPPEWKFF